MPRFPRQTAVAAALLAALFAGGCATSVAGTPAADPRPQPSSGPGADPTAWADKVCGALVTYWRPQTPAALPNFDQFGENSPLSGLERSAGIKKAFSDYLGSVSAAIDQGQQQLRAAGPSPVAGGDGFVRSYLDAMQQNGRIVADAKGEIDSVDPADIGTFQKKLEGGVVEQKLRSFVLPQGLDKLGNTPRLVKALERAPKCGEFRSIAQPAPPPP